MGEPADHEPLPVRPGGVVFRVGEELFFLPASIAMRISPIPEMARVPGGPLELRGVALVGGAMIPVVDVVEGPGAEPSGAMLVCALLGESVGLVGIDVVATGRFDPGERPGDVTHDGETARAFDVAAVIARVREGRWAV
ncbi:MAG: chemotaxis protein CheW [Labilithrix sp.]|nr:chemotaxis protein CheW [Labilithrix sp.]